ncbi:MAG: LamG-like jellyroll fold domain-containing protein, partial [Candidatus Paceibacterota bacterium]
MGSIKRRAFTLIELLVVIAIIGILSALIVVGMNSTTQKATIAKAQVFSNSLRNSLMSNLVSEWRLDNASGATATDSWSGGNNGTLTAFANTTAGYGDSHTSGWMSSSNCISGTCLKFDGTDDYVIVPHNASLNFGNNSFTLSLWVQTTMAGNVSGISVLSKATSGSPYWNLLITRDLSHIEFFNYYPSQPYQYFSGAYYMVNDGKWHLLTLVENYGVNGMLYIDGRYQSTHAQAWGSPDNSANNLTIGGSSYNGLLDDVRIFNAAMPTSQIQQMYFAGLSKLFAKNQITQSEYQQRLA